MRELALIRRRKIRDTAAFVDPPTRPFRVRILSVCHPDLTVKLEEDSRPAEDDARAPAGDEPLPGTDPEPDAARGKGFSRLSLVGLVISVVAVAGVVWWALHQEPPQFPDEPAEWAALAAAVALYALATLVRGERWHSLIRAERAEPDRADAHGLNVVGYAGNNVLPARAGDAVRVFLMAPRAAASKKAVLGTLLAERLLDIVVILALFVVVGYGLLGEVGAGDLRLDRSSPPSASPRSRRSPSCSCAATSACTPSPPRSSPRRCSCAAATA